MSVSSTPLRQSPICIPVMGLAGGMLASASGLFEPPKVICLSICVILLSLAMLVQVNQSGRRLLNSAICIVSLSITGYLWHHINTSYRPADSIEFVQTNSDLTVVGKLCGIPQQTRTGGVITLKVIGVETERGVLERRSGKIQISLGPDCWKTISKHPGFLPGVILRCESVLLKPTGFIHPGAFNPGHFLEMSGIYRSGYIAHPEFIQIIGSTNYLSPGRFLGRIQRRAIQRLSGAEPQTDSSLICQPCDIESVSQALILGAKKTLAPTIHRIFRNSGQIHLLAISGLHLGILAGLINWILKRLPGTLFWRSVINIFSIWFYAQLTGCPTSVIRSALLITIYLLGRLLHRPSSLLNNLCVIAGGLLVFCPAWITDPGFQLTFAATFGIALLYPSFSQLFSWLPGRWLGPALAVSLAAQSATLPISAYWFNRIGILSFMTGLPLAPMTAASLVSGITAICTMLIPGINQLIYWFHHHLVEWLIASVAYTSDIPFVTLEVLTPPGWLVVVLLLVLAMAALMEASWWFNAFICALMIVLIAWGPLSRYPEKSSMDIWFIDVGNGDCCLIRFPDGVTMLVDAGGIFGSEFDIGEKVVLRTIRTLGISRIDIAVISHPHPDHQLGFQSVFKSFQPEQFWVMNRYEAQPDFEDLIQTAETWDVPVRSLDDRNIFSIFPVSTNNRSIILGIRYGDFRLLLPGDAELEIEDSLIEYGPHIRSSVLKAGHHGSRSSSSQKFLGTVDPELVFIPSGNGNQFGHPHLSVMRRIHATLEGVPVMRSDLHGTVHLKTDGKTVEVRWMTRHPPG